MDDQKYKTSNGERIVLARYAKNDSDKNCLDGHYVRPSVYEFEDLIGIFFTIGNYLEKKPIDTAALNAGGMFGSNFSSCGVSANETASSSLSATHTTSSSFSRSSSSTNSSSQSENGNTSSESNSNTSSESGSNTNTASIEMHRSSSSSISFFK